MRARYKKWRPAVSRSSSVSYWLLFKNSGGSTNNRFGSTKTGWSKILVTRWIMWEWGRAIEMQSRPVFLSWWTTTEMIPGSLSFHGNVSSCPWIGLTWESLSSPRSLTSVGLGGVNVRIQRLPCHWPSTVWKVALYLTGQEQGWCARDAFSGN